MKSPFKPIIASLFFATMLITALIILKGEEAGYWVDTCIYMAWIFYFFGDGNKKSPCIRRKSRDEEPQLKEGN